MKRIGMFALLAAVPACTDVPTEPMDGQPEAAFASIASCPLADVPAGANIVLCFETTLLPGVWHGFFMEVSEAQPPGNDGDFDRTRLNHPYVLVAPEGFRRFLGSDPVPGELERAYAFQAETNGIVWNDILRLVIPPNEPPAQVAVVAYWADASTVAADIAEVVEDLLADGSINGGQANALTRKIEQALRLLEEGRASAAAELVHAFIGQVEDLAAAGVLMTEQASALIQRARYLLEVM